jgi:WD repeat-containing protein 40A
VEHFATSEDWFAARNACYAHAWDASGTRLLVTGGPLAYGLKGCYVGVWR